MSQTQAVFKSEVSYESFKQDLLEHGPVFAVGFASLEGIDGEVIFQWLRKANLEPRAGGAHSGDNRVITLQVTK